MRPGVDQAGYAALEDDPGNGQGIFDPVKVAGLVLVNRRYRDTADGVTGPGRLDQQFGFKIVMLAGKGKGSEYCAPDQPEAGLAATGRDAEP